MIRTALRRIELIMRRPFRHFLRGDASIYISEGRHNHCHGSWSAAVFTDRVLSAVKIFCPMAVMLVIVGHWPHSGI